MDTSRVLTQLRFKNWRSLRDVTIDNLTPITVFIGANSSGKSNILDALHFLRRVSVRGLEQAIYTWGGQGNIQTIGVVPSAPVEISFSHFLSDSSPFEWREEIYFAERFKPSNSSKRF